MSHTSQNNVATILFLTVLLTACNGGGEDADKTPAPRIIPPIAEPSDASIDRSNDNLDDQATNSIGTNDTNAALIANNTFSLARTSCGLNGLSADTALENIATQHANYIKYVFANSTPTLFNAHYENEIADIANVTNTNNPFFGGLDLGARLSNADYANARFGAAENIAQSMYYSSAGKLFSSEVMASSMAKSLLAAPYHLRSLMSPSLYLTGTGMVTYKPYNKDATDNQGYVLVNKTAATQATKNATIEGVFTYPCQGVTDTVTALYNEIPDPVKHTGRDLQIDPIGQPVYISVPSARTINISNVTFYDMRRNINVPIELLDYRQDPYKNTTNALPENEAFILPITDDLKSCEAFSSRSKNCGLHGNSEYRVSFDVLIDNKAIERKSFVFKTGAVNSA
ncbi:CAP domain-containing protein [Psychrobacter aquaticus]|uniref:Allergen V5/TPX-1 related n=1 Tax=Psychrobacter aquaticus CMS 56 TaxID=1354303 RepID=U4T373_9GAMM|nr:CAP domain-containing protein [Psychrobacter aquaticus]ERL54456.1 allergen V5/TPX-1 related [Psychrobacter aquaticus CMS 56]